MRNKVIAVFTLAAMIIAPVAMAAQGDLSVNALACAATSVHPRVAATVPASAVQGQVFFKAEGTSNEYYVYMRKAADGTMWAYLPAPASSTKSFTYRVVTLDVAGKRASSPVMTVSTTESCPRMEVASSERTAQAAIVVGLTSNSQSAVPTGFECKDIVSYITMQGDLTSNDECRRMMAGVMPAASGSTATSAAAAGTSATEAATIGGLSHATIIALTAVGLVGAGVAIEQHHKHKHHKSKKNPGDD